MSKIDFSSAIGESLRGRVADEPKEIAKPEVEEEQKEQNQSDEVVVVKNNISFKKRGRKLLDAAITFKIPSEYKEKFFALAAELETTANDLFNMILKEMFENK